MDMLSWFRANQSLLLFCNAACLVEKQQINPNLIVFDLTRLMLKPPIYHTQDEYANQYTIYVHTC
jgi:hypothetical protein